MINIKILKIIIPAIIILCVFNGTVYSKYVVSYNNVGKVNIDRTLPIVELERTINSNTENPDVANKTQTITLTVKASDLNYKYNELNAQNIQVKVGQAISSTAKITVEEISNDNNEQKWNIKVTGVEETGQFSLIVKANNIFDKYNNGNRETTLNTAIRFDNIAPTIRVEGSKQYETNGKEDDVSVWSNTDVTTKTSDNEQVAYNEYYYNPKEKVFTGEGTRFDSPKTFTEEGYYKIVSIDTSGNKSEVIFGIDRTPPQIYKNKIVDSNLVHSDDYFESGFTVVPTDNLSGVNTIKIHTEDFGISTTGAATDGDLTSRETSTTATLYAMYEPYNIKKYYWYLKEETDDTDYKLIAETNTTNYKFTGLKKLTKYKAKCIAEDVNGIKYEAEETFDTLVGDVNVTKLPNNEGYTITITNIKDDVTYASFGTWNNQAGMTSGISWEHVKVENGRVTYTVQASKYQVQGYDTCLSTHFYWTYNKESASMDFFSGACDMNCSGKTKNDTNFRYWTPKQYTTTQDLEGKIHYYINDNAGNEIVYIYNVDRTESFRVKSFWRDQVVNQIGSNNIISETVRNDLSETYHTITLKKSVLDNIKSVSFDGMHSEKSDVEDLSLFLKKLTSLEELELKRCEFHTTFLFLNCPDTLKTVRVSEWNNNYLSIENFYNYKNIQNVYFDNLVISNTYIGGNILKSSTSMYNTLQDTVRKNGGQFVTNNVSCQK